MKIVHFCLSCFYVDGYAYQENQLVAQHVLEGHDVTVIASTESFDGQRRPCNVEPGDYMGTDGARVIRLPYRKWFPSRISAKIRAYPGVMALLNELNPDVVVFHGLCAWEMLTAAQYAAINPTMKLYADCHEDVNNSARNPISKWVLHFGFYRPIIRRCLPLIRKVLCISQESISFARDMYDIPPEKLEFYPLGGHVFDDDAYRTRRSMLREKHGWDEHTRVFVQSGKIDAAKRLTDSLRAFRNLDSSPYLRFVIAGRIMPDVEAEVRPLIGDDGRVIEAGWLEPEQLQTLLCAADVYVQPGSQSATMQMSLCCRCPVVLADVPSHRALYEDNGYLVQDSSGLTKALEEFSKMSQRQLAAMSERSVSIANKLLDYRQLARRVLN